MIMNISDSIECVGQIADEDGLRWDMTSTVQDGRERRSKTFNFNLADLTQGYSMTFLLALKLVFVNERNRLALVSIYSEYVRIKQLLLRVQDSRKIIGIVERVNLDFIVALRVVMQGRSNNDVIVLKRFFKKHKANNYLFSKDIRPEDFDDLIICKKGRDEAVSNILSQALSRATVVHILTAVENAYEEGEIDLGRYAFAMLAFQVYFRPGSYSTLRLMDLSRDENKETGQISWFLDMMPIKTRVDNPSRISVKITSDLGEILWLQRASVIEKFGHLVDESDIKKIALFPSSALRRQGGWLTDYSRENYGMISLSGSFSASYLRPIRKVAGVKLNFNALRHTVGTQLAIMGLPAKRIAAVLKHATNNTCQKYVDLFFKGVLDRISDAMQPAFDEHFPVYKNIADRVISKHDSIPKEKAIISEDLITGRRELTAECGRQSLCGYAPLACYDCSKFRPCWDADHTINLDLVDREISVFQGQGLAMQHEANKYKILRNAIRVVINICQLKAQAVGGGHCL